MSPGLSWTKDEQKALSKNVICFPGSLQWASAAFCREGPSQAVGALWSRTRSSTFWPSPPQQWTPKPRQLGSSRTYCSSHRTSQGVHWRTT